MFSFGERGIEVGMGGTATLEEAGKKGGKADPGSQVGSTGLGMCFWAGQRELRVWRVKAWGGRSYPPLTLRSPVLGTVPASPPPGAGTSRSGDGARLVCTWQSSWVPLKNSSSVWPTGDRGVGGGGAGHYHRHSSQFPPPHGVRAQPKVGRGVGY